jgi:hypothetical protein
MTEPIQVPTIGEPELPAEIVTERALEEIIQGSRVIHARHQGFTKAMARKLLAVQQENAKLREALKEAQWVEFVDSDHGSIWFCHDCRNDKKYGHHPECLIAAALKGKVQ